MMNPMRILVRLVLNWKFLEIISRCCATLSAIGCNSCICETWLMHIRDVPYSYEWHAFTCHGLHTWGLHSCLQRYASFIWVACLHMSLPSHVSICVHILVCSWKIDVWTAGKSFDLLREDSEILLSKDVFSTPSCSRVTKRPLFYTFVPRTSSLESRAIHPIEKRTCVRSFLHLQNPDKFEESVHIKIMFPEFIYRHYFCSKPQKRPVPVQALNFQEQINLRLISHIHEACRTYEWVMSRVWTQHV